MTINKPALDYMSSKMQFAVEKDDRLIRNRVVDPTDNCAVCNERYDSSCVTYLEAPITVKDAKGIAVESRYFFAVDGCRLLAHVCKDQLPTVVGGAK